MRNRSSIKSKTLTLPEIFNFGLNCFQIPNYQRGYSWENAQRKDLMLVIKKGLNSFFQAKSLCAESTDIFSNSFREDLEVLSALRLHISDGTKA